MKTAVYTCSNCGHFGGHSDFLSGDGSFECPKCGAPEESVTKQIVETTPVIREVPDVATMAIASVAIRGGIDKAEISQRLLDQLQSEAEHERLPEPKTLKAVVNAVRYGLDLPSILQNLVDAFALLGAGSAMLDQFVIACGETPEEYQPTN